MFKYYISIVYTVFLINYLACADAAHAQMNTIPFSDCDTCPQMVVIPAGTFVMGSEDTEPKRDADESPRHTVTIGAPFAVSRHEITRGEYAAFVKDTNRSAGPDCRVWVKEAWVVVEGKSWRDPGFVQTDSHPVACISWYDARAYTEWLAIKTNRPYRMLSEAEWEYTARANTATVYHHGDDPDGLCATDNGHDLTSMEILVDMPWEGVNCRDGHATTAPVGSFKPNPWGVFDVHGNVWEWLEDCYTASYDNTPRDGFPMLGGACEQRIYRGGGWSVQERGRRAANRGRFNPDDRYGQLGLRVALDLQ